ncbi:MAG: DUF1552 domain-containing protein [Opitutaceae bacterium]|nr:DUF1552 domain-containing protein [Opitutaceae bacterium]
MSAEPEHAPDEHDVILDRPLRPFTPPRNAQALTRRRFLRGAGTLVALPFLDSLPTLGAEARAVAAPEGEALPRRFPQRFATLFMGTGINGNHWWAKGAGAEMELSKTLAPLAPLRSKLNVIDGLFNRPSVGVGIHPGQTGNILSGMPLMKGAVLRGGISMDQVLANRLGEETVQPSLVLGCEQPVTGYHETNFSMAYSSHISWQSADSPVPMEVYPSLAFDSLFENRGNRRTQSILDRIKEDAAGLARKISAEDGRRLDEYLTSVREVEKRVDRMRGDQAKAEAHARDRGRPLLAMPRPDNGLPEDIRDHMRLMCDIVALAFQTDKTRIATLVLCRDLSGLFYPFLGVKKTHHSASHDDLSDDYEAISRYYVGHLAYLASRLEAMPEGEGTVLDHTCLLFLSNMWSGYRHDNTRLPVLTLGGLGGTLKTGRVIDYAADGDEHRKLCSLHLSIMDRMGVRLPRFGDADARLARI